MVEDISNNERETSLSAIALKYFGAKFPISHEEAESDALSYLSIIAQHAPDPHIKDNINIIVAQKQWVAIKTLINALAYDLLYDGGQNENIEILKKGTGLINLSNALGKTT